MKTITFPVKGLNVAGCAREIEKRLGKQDGISQVEASYVTQTVTITFDDTRLSEAALREQVQDCGFACGELRGALQGVPGKQGGGMHVHPAATPGQEHHVAHTFNRKTSQALSQYIQRSTNQVSMPQRQRPSLRGMSMRNTQACPMRCRQRMQG